MYAGSSPSNLNGLDLAELEAVVRTCAHDNAAGKVVSTARAVEELRIITGDFVSSDRELADVLSAKALELGYVIVFDEQTGAGIVIPG